MRRKRPLSKRQGILLLLCFLLVFVSGYVAGSHRMRTTFKDMKEPLYQQNAGDIKNDLNVLSGEEQLSEGYFLNEEIFPKNIDGFTLYRQIGGDEALELIGGFMGGELPVKNCYVPYYRGEQYDVILWVVELENSLQSAEVFKTMEKRLQDSSSFKNKQLLNLSSNDINSTTSAKMVYVELKEKQYPFNHHFFYQRENWIFWMMSNHLLDKEELMTFYWSIPA